MVRSRRSFPLFMTSSLVTGVAAFVGCSLTGITDVKVGACETSQECIDALNEDEGLYPGCAAFECVSAGEYKQCRRIEEERLDALDNDCDYLVDESDRDEDSVVSVDTSDLASGFAPLESATVAQSPILSRIYLQKKDKTAVVVEPEGGNSASVKMMAHATSGAVNFNIDLEEGCFSTTSTVAQECDINQSVVAAGSGLGYFAQIKTQGCAAGELRVGAIAPASPSEFIDRGPGFRNPSYRGVATEGSPCSQNGKAACVDAKEEYSTLAESGATSGELQAALLAVSQECGVSHPAIAATGKQALLSFLGAPINDEICGGPVVDVFALILHERIKEYGDEFAWADPSGDGVPDKIGTTRSAQPPAVQALAGMGFLLAHSNEEGDILVQFAPLQENPPGNSGTECPDDDCESRDGLHTPLLEDLVEFTTLSTSGGAEGIRMQWMTLDDDSGDAAVVVTWVKGCADLDNELSRVPAFAQILRLDLSGDTPVLTFKGPVIDLGPTQSFPLAVPSNEPFVVVGFERGDKTATDTDESGFFVLTRPLGIQAVRLAVFDGSPVAAGEIIEVAPSSGAGPNSYRYLAALGDGSRDEFLLTTTEGDEILKAEFESGK